MRFTRQVKAGGAYEIAETIAETIDSNLYWESQLYVSVKLKCLVVSAMAFVFDKKVGNS